MNEIKNLKYAVINLDESFVESPFMTSRKKAKQWWIDTTGEAWDDTNYQVQGFNASERAAIRKAPEQ